MSIYENTFIRFATAGCAKLNEPHRIHGRLVDLIPVQQEEVGLGYKAKILPSRWTDLARKLFPRKRKYIILPLREEEVFYPGLLIPQPETAAYMAEVGLEFTMCYLGSVTGEPAIDEFKVIEMVDRLAYEKGVYKYVALKAYSLLSKLSRKQHEFDRETVSAYLDILDKIKRIERRPPGRPPKESYEEESVSDRLKFEEAEKGHGLLSQAFKR